MKDFKHSSVITGDVVRSGSLGSGRNKAFVEIKRALKEIDIFLAKKTNLSYLQVFLEAIPFKSSFQIIQKPCELLFSYVLYY